MAEYCKFKSFILLIILLKSSSCADTLIHPCAQGCDCHFASVNHVATYLFQYRWQEGNDDAASTGHREQEMTCTGLATFPEFIPPDVKVLTIQGIIDNNLYQQDSSHNEVTIEAFSEERKSMSKIEKTFLYGASYVEELQIEGNRVKTLVMYGLDMFENLSVLRLRGNMIQIVEEYAFAGLDKLTSLDLSNNLVKKLPKIVLMDLPRLAVFRISNNKLRGLPRRIFRRNSELETLDLSSNNIRDFHHEMFFGLTKLRDLNLNGNRLKAIRIQWFTDLFSLVKFSCSNNHIVEVSPWNFRRVPGLQILNLSANRIRSIPNGLFAENHNLTDVDLSQNNFTDIERQVFANCIKLQTLDLSRNSIRDINRNAFSDLINVHKLSLHSNQLLELPSDVFANMSQLRELDLSWNRLKIVKSRSFYTLLHLNDLKLNNNDITTVQNDAFAINTSDEESNLAWLTLHNNNIIQMLPRSLQHLAHLKYIHLGNNQINNIDDTAFSSLSRTSVMFLSHNKLTKLPIQLFATMKALRYLHLDANRLPHIQDDLFAGLDRIEMINLQDNHLSKLTRESLQHVSHAHSLNLVSNHFKSFDFSVLDMLPRLVYLDLAKNSISSVQLKTQQAKYLRYISLADNLLKTLSPAILELLVGNGVLHLENNPWTCNCSLSWLLNAREEGIKLEYEKEIVCKLPESAIGKQVLSLEAHNFSCEVFTPDDNRVDMDNRVSARRWTAACGAGNRDSEDDGVSAEELSNFMVRFGEEDHEKIPDCFGVLLDSSFVYVFTSCLFAYEVNATVQATIDNPATEIAMTILEHNSHLGVTLLKINYSTDNTDNINLLKGTCIFGKETFVDYSERISGIVLTLEANDWKVNHVTFINDKNCSAEDFCLQEQIVDSSQEGEEERAWNNFSPVWISTGDQQWKFAGTMQDIEGDFYLKSMELEFDWLETIVNSRFEQAE